MTGIRGEETHKTFPLQLPSCDSLILPARGKDLERSLKKKPKTLINPQPPSPKVFLDLPWDAAWASRLVQAPSVFPLCSAGWGILWGGVCTALHLCPAMRKEKGNQLSRGMQRLPRQELIQEKAKQQIHIYTHAHKGGR